MDSIPERSWVRLWIAVHRSHFAFELGGDVDDEGGGHRGVETGVEDPLGAMCGRFGVEALETGESSALFGQVAGGRMVWMLGLPVGDDHQARTQAANLARHRHAAGQDILHAAIRIVEVAAPGEQEGPGGGGCGVEHRFRLLGARDVARREVKHASAVAEFGQLDEGAAGGLLGVARMGADDQQVQRWDGILIVTGEMEVHAESYQCSSGRRQYASRDGNTLISNMPIRKPPTWAKKAMPPVAPVELSASVPTPAKNCKTNQ